MMFSVPGERKGYLQQIYSNSKYFDDKYDISFGRSAIYCMH